MHQVETTMVVPSPVPGLSAPVFGRLPGPNFQSTVPPVGPTFGITPGAAGPTAFPTDAYGISTDRPKKVYIMSYLSYPYIHGQDHLLFIHIFYFGEFLGFCA